MERLRKFFKQAGDTINPPETWGTDRYFNGYCQFCAAHIGIMTEKSNKGNHRAICPLCGKDFYEKMPT